jgi:hypothetical protein
MRIGNYLKSGLLAAGVGAALLAGGCATVDDSKNWVDMKNPEELRTLFSDKTFTGKGSYDVPVAWISYNRADGHGLFVLDAKRFKYTWKVTGADQVCTQSERGSNCYRYQRHRTHATFHRSFNLTQNRVSEFSVSDGVPKF